MKAAFHGRLDDVLRSAFDTIAEAVLSNLPEGGAEACDHRISQALVTAGCAALRVAVKAGGADATQLGRRSGICHRAGRPPARMMSSFGVAAYVRQRYRRRGQDSIAPADGRFEIVAESWSPLAARQDCLAVSMATAGHCEALFRELGRIQLSATALGHLVNGRGPVWGVLEEGVLEVNLARKTTPAEARAPAISIDGAMIGMRKVRGRAGARECLSSGGLPGSVVGHGIPVRRGRAAPA